jgi:hypothetical protein
MPEYLLQDLSPKARVITAVLPFALAMMLRLLLGRTRTASWLVMLATVWFAVNVLMAPLSEPMRRDIRDLGRYLP